jgi:hypothetical protein
VEEAEEVLLEAAEAEAEAFEKVVVMHQTIQHPLLYHHLLYL